MEYSGNSIARRIGTSKAIRPYEDRMSIPRHATGRLCSQECVDLPKELVIGYAIFLSGLVILVD